LAETVLAATGTTGFCGAGAWPVETDGAKAARTAAKTGRNLRIAALYAQGPTSETEPFVA
jgi:hypothetical protein